MGVKKKRVGLKESVKTSFTMIIEMGRRAQEVVRRERERVCVYMEASKQKKEREWGFKWTSCWRRCTERREFGIGGVRATYAECKHRAQVAQATGAVSRQRALRRPWPSMLVVCGSKPVVGLACEHQEPLQVIVSRRVRCYASERSAEESARTPPLDGFRWTRTDLHSTVEMWQKIGGDSYPGKIPHLGIHPYVPAARSLAAGLFSCFSW